MTRIAQTLVDICKSDKKSYEKMLFYPLVTVFVIYLSYQMTLFTFTYLKKKGFSKYRKLVHKISEDMRNKSRYWTCIRILKRFLKKFPQPTFAGWTTTVLLFDIIFYARETNTFVMLRAGLIVYFILLYDGKLEVMHTWAVIAITRIAEVTCTHVRSNGIVTSCICITRLGGHALVDIYDEWKQNVWISLCF